MTLAKFNWRALEKKWQKKWAWSKIDETDPDPRRPKYFVTAAYPYPNSPQHIGHARTYTIADVNARFHRMNGYNTLYPMGFHYTGTPLYAMAKRLSQNDREIIETFTKIYGIPAAKLDSIKEPRKMADFFRDDIKKGMVEIDGTIYPTATLRPETIFGVTNIWVNPNAQYVRAQVDGEPWVITKDTVDTLEHQNHTVSVEKEFPGTDLLWKTVVNPLTKASVPILPADFVEPDNGTGLVMSVPGHAPYDYQALIEVKARYESSPEPHESLEKIQPISIIRLEGFSEFPAADIVKKFDVKGQDDPRLEDATKELYSKEFHNGVMNDNARPYSGMSVENAREAVVRDLTSSGKMSIMYELLNKPLVCRCGAKLVVHVVDKQWLINYGEPEWKKQAHQCLDEMTILPEERGNEFN